jgi:hypothetical protein
MRVIIAGSRSITDYQDVERIITNIIEKNQLEVDVIVSGSCKTGVDQLGEQYAEKHEIKLIKFPADWGFYQNRAGYIRNILMAENADGLIAIWDGVSRGTAHMIRIAKTKGLQVFIEQP